MVSCCATFDLLIRDQSASSWDVYMKLAVLETWRGIDSGDHLSDIQEVEVIFDIPSEVVLS